MKRNMTDPQTDKVAFLGSKGNLMDSSNNKVFYSLPEKSNTDRPAVRCVNKKPMLALLK